MKPLSYKMLTVALPVTEDSVTPAIDIHAQGTTHRAAMSVALVTAANPPHGAAPMALKRPTWHENTVHNTLPSSTNNDEGETERAQQ